MNKPLSTRIGELFAHVQDLFDTMIHTTIKRVGENDKLDKKTGKIVGFITRIGDAYFNKYKDIKSDDSK
jgi:hypothetical protein